MTYLSKNRIRSHYQRRILTWLVDNSGSVSEVSKSLKLQTPHASSSLSELRKRGLVHRDDAHGIRGAIHSITQAGRKQLEEDRLSLYKRYVAKTNQESDGIVLETKGRELLLCYHKNPPNSLISLPLYPYSDNSDDAIISSGTDGVIWASVVPDSTRWYSTDTLKQVSPPNELGTGTLDAWLQTTDSFALVRAILFEPIKQWNVPPGTEFSTPNLHSSPLPKVITTGKHSIGNIVGTELGVMWENRLHAHLSSNVDINILINSFSQEAYVMRKNPVKPDVTNIPIGSLFEWLKLRHKRLGENKITEKFLHLKSIIQSDSINGLSFSLQKEIAKDFGYCNWIDEIPRNIEISNLSSNGLKAIIRHLKNSLDAEYVIEWDWPINDDIEFLNHLIRDTNCRLLVTKVGPPRNIISTLGTLNSLSDLAMVRLELPNQHSLDIKLTGDSRPQMSISHSVVPADAVELLSAFNDGNWQLDLMSEVSRDFETSSQIWQALSKYPDGDEMWANSIETSNPLAAWIATPIEHRPSRWVRVQNKFDTNWADLLPLENSSAELIAASLHQGSENFRSNAIDQLAQRFLLDHQLLIEIENLDGNSLQSSGISTAILLVCDKLPDEFSKYVTSAVDNWLDYPLFPARVLSALFTSNQHGDTDRFGVYNKVVLASKIHPKDSILFNWGRYVACLKNSETIQNELMRTFMTLLPYHWWQANSSDWLVSQLSSSAGRRWLTNQTIPWPALIFRLDGELSGPPGSQSKFVRKIPPTSELLFIPIMQDCLAKDSLMDVYDLASKTEDNKFNITPRTHPMIGYLVRSLQEWPDFDSDIIDQGDKMTGCLLFGISYHKNII